MSGQGLLIDSCGTVARLALFAGDRVVAQCEYAARRFSAEWPDKLRELLTRAEWELRGLHVIAVVHGPGSFTGMRVGLAAAKGLCEATGARLIAVSRLEVLSRAGGTGAVAVLDAGRGEVYVRDAGVERLMPQAQALEAVAGREVVAVEERVAETFGVEVIQEPLSAIVLLVRERSRAGLFDDPAAVDANYVRGEAEIYGKQASA